MKRKTPTTEPKPPAAVAELRREGRLARIAKALASGATVTDIAEAEGIGRTVASRGANAPECRQIISDFVNKESDEMHAMFYRCLRSIEQVLGAGKKYMMKDGHRSSMAAPPPFTGFTGA